MLPRACKSSCALWPVAFGLALVWGCPGGNSGGAGDPIGVLVFNDGDQGTGPLALGQVAFTQPGVPVTVRLVGESPSGEPLGFSIVSAPAVGELGGIEPVDELTADVTYIPPAEFIGAAEFTYQVDDGVEQSTIATVIIGVCPEVAFELDVYEGEIPLTVHATAFTVAGGGLPDGELCWSFGGHEDCGAMDTHRERSHTFSAGGTYAVTLSLLLAGVPVPLSCMPADLKDISAAQVIALDGPPVRIWGQVRDAHGRALPGVSVATDDGAAATVSAASGRYKLALASGWSGTLRPQAPGRTFEPASRSYEGLVADKVSQDFVAQAAPPPLGTLVVSPSTGLSSSGPEGGPFTPGSKVYTLKNQGEQASDWVAEKSADWLSLSLDSGTLGPGQYASVRVSLTAAAGELAAGEYQDTVAFGVRGAGRSTTDVTIVLTISASGEPEVTISGRVTETDGETGIPGVTLDGLPGDPVTDDEGYYSDSVPEGWSGTATPSRAGYTFSPESQTYSSVTAGQSGQDYTATLGGLGLTPIARWDVVPYQRINAGETLNLGVVAFSKNGIDRVCFTVTGHGYSGVSPVYVTELSLNPQSGVWEYWIPLAANDFTSDGQIAVEATVIGRDGGVRDKNTGGGGLGLDALTLTVTPGGTLTQAEAWVDVAGSDATGVVNDPARPFKTWLKAAQNIAIWNNSHGFGTTPEGGIIRFNVGTHSDSQQGGVWDTLACNNEYLTLTAASGGTPADTILRGTAICKITKLRVTGIGLAGADTLNPNSVVGPGAIIWVDNCDLTGLGRLNAGVGPVGINWGQHYWTNCRTSECRWGLPLSGKNMLARSVTAQEIGEDVFRNTYCLINCEAYVISPLLDYPKITGATWHPAGHSSGHTKVIEQTAAFAAYTPGATEGFRCELPGAGNPTSLGRYPKAQMGGKISDDAIWLTGDTSEFPAAGPIDGWLQKDWHSDVWQWVYFDGMSGCDKNVIIYGLRARDCYYQGITNNTWYTGSDTASDIAFVNVYVKATYGSYWCRETDNMLLWHVTFDERFYFSYDVGGAGPQESSISNLSMRACCFNGYFYNWLLNHSQYGSVDWTDVADNHYRYAASEEIVTPGSRYSTGDPLLGEHGVPCAGSPLLHRITPRLVPVDVLAAGRSSLCDIGAYEPALP